MRVNLWAMASETDAQVLERYKLARDRILQAVEDGDPTVEIQGVDGKRRRVTDPQKYLEFLEKQISRYEARVSAASGRARNYAEFHRR